MWSVSGAGLLLQLDTYYLTILLLCLENVCHVLLTGLQGMVDVPLDAPGGPWGLHPAL
jgi:hypothetical protein